MFLFKWFVSGIIIGMASNNAIIGVVGGFFVALLDSFAEYVGENL